MRLFTSEAARLRRPCSGREAGRRERNLLRRATPCAPPATTVPDEQMRVSPLRWGALWSRMGCNRVQMSDALSALNRLEYRDALAARYHNGIRSSVVGGDRLLESVCGLQGNAPPKPHTGRGRVQVLEPLVSLPGCSSETAEAVLDILSGPPGHSC